MTVKQAEPVRAVIPIVRSVSVLGVSAMLAACGGGETDEAPPAAPDGMVAEAGMVEIEPVDYRIAHGDQVSALRSGRARLFWAFQPAAVDPARRPLAVLFNGGPGASSAILLGLGVGARAVSGGSVADNPASWTRFANLLFVDARMTGLSYGIVDGAADPAVRAAEIGLASHNAFIDAADVARLVARFVQSHPALARNDVVIAGESYGGVRASILADMLRRPARYDDGGDGGFSDPALAAELSALAAGREGEPAVAGLVLLQGRISNPYQDASAGELLEAPGSVLHELAAEIDVPFVGCADKPPPCDPYDNALAFVEAAGRDPYDVRQPPGALVASYAALAPVVQDPASLEALLGSAPASIEELYAAERGHAFRALDGGEPSAEGLASAFGTLQPWDRYFLVECFDALGIPFAGQDASALGIERQGPRWGELFLDALRDVPVFVTSAGFDVVIYGPALPGALERYDTIVESASIEGSTLRVRWVDGVERTATVATYPNAGHTVSLDSAAQLADDVETWLSTLE